MDEEGEGAAHQRRVVANHSVQKLAVAVCEGHEEIFHGFGGSKNRGLRERSATDDSASGRGLGSHILANNHETLDRRKKDGGDMIQLRFIDEC